jgi:hypothetical protein
MIGIQLHDSISIGDGIVQISRDDSGVNVIRKD